ncbi:MULTISPECIES: hypothetical protein [unclassified Shewanella]|uniref:hypothetical protein n=1 Tax=unclassified Shewanella TaxID=196818 RepID=UPI0020A7B15B|nr:MULTISPECIES: hypothetical protein [unclassified Shewanella]MCP3126774.1 hypothetical protein [Shewanella sp. KJ2020]
MHKHPFFALCLKASQCQHAIVVPYDDTGLKHLTLIRINSGREEANSPQFL